jgi:hypothetical protein
VEFIVYTASIGLFNNLDYSYWLGQLYLILCDQYQLGSHLERQRLSSLPAGEGVTPMQRWASAILVRTSAIPQYCGLLNRLRNCGIKKVAELQLRTFKI